MNLHLHEHLPLYEGGRRAGRIAEITGGRIVLSTATLTMPASIAQGRHLVPLTAPEGWVQQHDAKVGQYLIIESNGWLTLSRETPVLSLVEDPHRSIRALPRTLPH